MQTEFTVLTEDKIKQKLAGYKSNYTKRVNAARTAKERKELEAKRDAYIGERETALREENRKQIQRRAGHLSWETRRANSAKRNAPRTETPAAKKPADQKRSQKKCHHSRVGIRVISK